MSSNKAWVTLATNDSYSLGALVLAHSLKTVQTVHKLAILITPGVTPSMKIQIEAVFDDVKVVDVLDSKDQSHLALMCRPELGVTFTKLHCWTLTKYEKCVFLDADTLVLQNCDELFEREEFSAAPDPGWPDCFNSGVFVYKPSQDTFSELLEFARTRGSFDGGDQGLLNMFFKDWSHKDISKHLSFTYNVVWSSTYSYLPALKQFGQNMKIIHFIASSKPWLQSFNTETRLVTATSGGSGLQALLQFWWDLFCRYVHPGLSTEMIESRLSSCYSYDFHPEAPPNNTFNNYTPFYTPNNNNSYSYHTPTCEPPIEDHYNFIDPWDKYLNSNEQKPYNIEHEKVIDQTEYHNGDRNLAGDVCINNNCEQEVETNYYVNSCDTEEQSKVHSFQNSVRKDYNSFENETKNNEHYEDVREYNESKQEKEPNHFENFLACSDDIPINFNSSKSINNCHPDSSTHSEVSKDQPCDLNGGLAGQFARISLDKKTNDQKALEDFLRRQSWEHGNMDYLGKDSFSNIWSKINETLGHTAEAVESDIVKTPSPPEVVHAEEPKPLKSALKKTSTTIPPVNTELIENNEEPIKQLVKLNLSEDIIKLQAPETPTVTSPTPPTTPASQAQEASNSEAVESVEELPKPEVVKPIEGTQTSVAQEYTKETLKSTEYEMVKPETVESIIETPKLDTCEIETPILTEEETPKLDPVDSVKVLSEKNANEPVEEVSQTTTAETDSKSQTSVDNSPPLVSNDPPIAPKRTNKGSSNVSKSIQSPEKK